MERIRKNSFKEGPEIYQHKIIKSPVGLITLIASEKALVSLLWPSSSAKLELPEKTIKKENSILTATTTQLEEYFAGKRKIFDLPLDPQGTEFQKLVWQQLAKIPYGKFISYGEQARRLGRPKAARAVGAANGKNPISIIIPCHRVLGASGTLTGYAGGLEVKQRLLRLEGATGL